MDRPSFSDPSRTEAESCFPAGNLFAGADPDVILAITADILACLSGFTRLYPDEDMPPESVRGLGHILCLVGQGVAQAHHDVARMMESTMEERNAPAD